MHGHLLGQQMVIAIAMVATALVSIALSAIALWRRPIKGSILALGFVILFTPYAIAAAAFPADWFEIAYGATQGTLAMTPIVAMAIAFVAVLRR
jgi:hypothetical protein